MNVFSASRVPVSLAWLLLCVQQAAGITLLNGRTEGRAEVREGRRGQPLTGP